MSFAGAVIPRYTLPLYPVSAVVHSYIPISLDFIFYPSDAAESRPKSAIRLEDEDAEDGEDKSEGREAANDEWPPLNREQLTAWMRPPSSITGPCPPPYPSEDTDLSTQILTSVCVCEMRAWKMHPTTLVVLILSSQTNVRGFDCNTPRKNFSENLYPPLLKKGRINPPLNINKFEIQACSDRK